MSAAMERVMAEPEVTASQVDGRRSFFRNTGFSIVHQVATVILAVLLVPYMLWRLGVDKYGLWLTLQIFNIFGLVSLAELGFQGAITRHLVQYHGRGDTLSFRRLLASSFALFLLIGGVCGGLVAAFAWSGFVDAFGVPPAYVHEMRLALSIYAAGLVLCFPLLVVKAFFAATQDLATQKVWETLDRVAFAIAMLALLALTSNLAVVALVEQVTMLVVAGVFVLRARLAHRAWFAIDLRHASRKSLDGVLGLSGFVFLTNISNQVFVKGPEALIGAILGPVALAHYTIATRIPRVFKTAQGALNAAVMPFVALLGMSEDGRETKRRFALRGLRTSYLALVPPACFVIVFADLILSLWVGPQYAWLGGYLAVYMVWQLMMIVTGFGTATFTSMGDYRGLVWRSLAINIAFVAITVVGLNWFGLAGSFAALLVAGMTMLGVSIVATARANGFGFSVFLSTVFVGPILGSGLLGLALFGAARAVLSHYGMGTGLLAIVTAGMVYLAVLYRFTVRPSERQGLRMALAKFGPRP